MTLVSGGQAGLNSVVFYNRSFRVKARRMKNGRIKVQVIQMDNRKTTKLGEILKEIPFIRGVWLLVELMLLNWRLYIITFCLYFVMFMTLIIINPDVTESNASSLFDVLFTRPYHFIFLLGVLLCASLFIKLTEVGKYHSAEHMVDNAYENSQNISLQSVQKYSRVHKHCGTNLVIFSLIFYFIFHLLIDNKFLVFMLSFSLGYELYTINYRWIRKALTPIYSFSYYLQRILFTAKPESKHLEVAIAAYQELINLSKSSEGRRTY